MAPYNAVTHAVAWTDDLHHALGHNCGCVCVVVVVVTSPGVVEFGFVVLAWRS